MFTNKGNLIKAELIEHESEKKTNNDFVTRIEGDTNFFSAYGTFNISGLLLEASGGSKLSLNLKVDDVIKLDVESNKNYLSPYLTTTTTDSAEYVIEIQLVVRPCLLGEGLKASGACYKCPENTFLLKAPIRETACKPCKT